MLTSKTIKKFAYLLITAGGVALGGVVLTLGGRLFQQAQGENEVTSPTLNAVLDRGYVKCAISAGLEGLSAREYPSDFEAGDEFGGISIEDLTNGFYHHATGIEADYCRAIAVAVLGDVKAVAYIAASTNRVARLKSVVGGEQDVLFRSSLFRVLNKEESINFSPVFYYEPVILLNNQTDSDPASSTYKELRVCSTQAGFLELMTRKFSETNQMNWDIITENPETGKVFFSFKHLFKAYNNNHCDAIVGKWSLLHTHQGFEETSKKIADSQLVAMGKQYVLPHVANIRNDDHAWQEIVNAVIWATIDADVHGFTSAGDQEYTRAKMWEPMGLAPANVAQIIKEVGNYQEIFERNFGDISPLKEINRHYLLDPNGMLITPF